VSLLTAGSLFNSLVRRSGRSRIVKGDRELLCSEAAVHGKRRGGQLSPEAQHFCVAAGQRCRISPACDGRLVNRLLIYRGFASGPQCGTSSPRLSSVASNFAQFLNFRGLLEQPPRVNPPLISHHAGRLVANKNQA